MVRMLIHWGIMALAVGITAWIIPGFEISGVLAALVAAVIIGFINATVGLLLKIVTFPLTVVTLGLFWLLINALMLKLASALVPGFYIRGFAAAFFGAIVLSLVNMLLKKLLRPERIKAR